MTKKIKPFSRDRKTKQTEDCVVNCKMARKDMEKRGDEEVR